MKKIYVCIAIISSIVLVSCDKDAEKETITETLNNPINDFTWKAMNSWYKWQADVPNLADTKDDNKNEYHTYLNSFSKPEDLFKSLLYRPGQADRFSWFIEDYIEQEKRFQGVSKSFGFTPKAIKINATDRILLVTRVSKNSPASRKGLKRGDIIIGINGVKFAGSGWDSVIKKYYDDNVEFILGQNDGITEKSKVRLTREEIADDAIQLSKIFQNVGGKKVGYLVYNGFRSSYNKALNNTFAEFKSAGINELILDLRYNGGGSVLTCGYLASMIYGEGTNKEVFAKSIFNSKNPKSGFTLPFLNGIFQYNSKGEYIKGQDIPLNKLTGISKLYVITSQSTASASEMIINGLRPYIEVVTVGTKTYGKNVGSNTLYDSPDFRSKKGINTKHRNAMQPITFKIYNKNGQSDYTQGFTPTINVNEYKNWSNFLPFGDENEILLKTVLNKIKGISGRPAYISEDPNIQLLGNAIKEDRFEKEMYFETNFMVNNLK